MGLSWEKTTYVKNSYNGLSCYVTSLSKMAIDAKYF